MVFPVLEFFRSQKFWKISWNSEVWNTLKLIDGNINLQFWRLTVKITSLRWIHRFSCVWTRPVEITERKWDFRFAKRKISPALRAHQKRGKSARASPSPHHTSLEEQSAPLNAQPLSAMVSTEVLSGMHGLRAGAKTIWYSVNIALHKYLEH